MRICFFTPNFLPNVGGTEYVTDALARQFHAKGHRVVVLAHGRPAPLDLPYPVVWYRKPLFPRLFPERVARHLRRLHRRERFDLFLANYAHPTGYAALRLGQRLGVPTVVISHGGDLYRSANDRARPHLWRRTLYTYRHADALVAISPYIQTLIREINPSPRRLVPIPNGIDLAAINQSASRPTDFTETRPFILCLGNLGPMKGFDDALAAFAQVRDRLGGLTLAVVGSGELEQPLKQQAADLKITDRVFFAGRRTGNDKRWFLQNCLFGLMPSIEEGHPIVGLEFLAVGKPIVCSTNPAFDGMYDDGINSFRVPARDRDALAQAILNLSAADLPAMSTDCLRRAQNYTWPAIADRYLALFNELVPPSPLASPNRKGGSSPNS